jgi:hypothetical protein
MALRGSHRGGEGRNQRESRDAFLWGPTEIRCSWWVRGAASAAPRTSSPAPRVGQQDRGGRARPGCCLTSRPESSRRNKPSIGKRVGHPRPREQTVNFTIADGNGRFALLADSWPPVEKGGMRLAAVRHT